MSIEVLEVLTLAAANKLGRHATLNEIVQELKSCGICLGPHAIVRRVVRLERKELLSSHRLATGKRGHPPHIFSLTPKGVALLQLYGAIFQHLDAGSCTQSKRVA